MTVVAVLQARTSSSRLPGKVLKPILGRPMLALQVERLKRCREIDRLVVATSDGPEDDPIQALCEATGTDCFRGSLNDVLDRVHRAALAFGADHVVRLTGDCPLADPAVIDRLVQFHLTGGFTYSSNVEPPTWPDGLDAEILTLAALETANAEAEKRSEREHVTPFVRFQPERFPRGNLVHDGPDLSDLRWCVDGPEDFDLITRIFEALHPKNPDFATAEILALLEENPEMKTCNKNQERNEGWTASQKQDGEQA